MKKLMLPALCACALAMTACVSVTNNLGDSAIRAASAVAQGELASTNTVNQAQGTNAVTAASGTRIKGGLIVQTVINKIVSPDPSTALQYLT